MEAVWGEGDQVQVIHPASACISGRALVREGEGRGYKQQPHVASTPLNTSREALHPVHLQPAGSWYAGKRP
jgi:hypothetical protein